MSTLSGRVRMLALAAGLIAWGSAILYGARLVLTYDFTPGPQGEPAAQWPSASRLPKPEGRFRLVLLVHPDCPCTRASLTELAIILARTEGRVAASVVFVKPGSPAREIGAASAWARAQSIPGAFVFFDEAGRENAALRGRVSGQTLLYSPTGELLFSGGITPSRGHEGTSKGRESLVALVTGRGPGEPSAPVFGCSLANPERAWQ